jgi:prepilin-type processing-associated H-X9-DG protein
MSAPRPLQFSLKTIMAITAGFALLFASGSWFGVPGYLFFLLLAGLAAVFAFSRDFDVFVASLALYLFFISVMCCGVFPLLLDSGSRGATRRSQCTNNLKQIGLGLQNFHDVYGCFPPACITDKNGKPMHSWRVLILPFIEQKALYDKYDFNEPWDGPNNSKLAKEMPPIFGCPSDTANPGILTDYVGIVGPETIWQPDQGTTFKEISDGSSHTIAVVEASGAGINWMAPQDLPFSAISKGLNPKQGIGMSSHHPGAAVALFADGHTQTIQENISARFLKAICTKAGGETIDGDF